MLFFLCFLSTLSPIWKTVDAFIERKEREKRADTTTFLKPCFVV